MIDKEYLLQETIVLLSADIYQKLYGYHESFTDTAEKIISLAKKFEKELNWQEFDERDYIEELEKFEENVLNEYEKRMED